MRYISIIILVLSTYACKEMTSFEYAPYSDVGIEIMFKDAEYHKEHNSTFFYFELRVKNAASRDVFFNPGNLKGKINGVVSKETYYNSLASVMPERKILDKGESSFKLYFVLPGEMDESINRFEVLNFGLENS